MCACTHAHVCVFLRENESVHAHVCVRERERKHKEGVCVVVRLNGRVCMYRCSHAQMCV